MPAVARKQTPESQQNYRVVSDERVPVRARSSRVRRWHEAAPGNSSSQMAGARSTPARRDENDAADLHDLLEHFTGENAARTSQQQKEVEAHRTARKRARLRHRPFRMTILASAMAGAPLALLACLLWIKSSSLEFSRQDQNLNNKINAVRSESQRTRDEIAAINASPRVEEWARERSWRRANPYEFDNVSKGQEPVSFDSADTQVESSDVP